jgi:hypothetical protein
MVEFRFLSIMSLFFLSLNLSALFYIKVEEEERFNLWDFVFLILNFGSFNRDERMMRLKTLAICGSKKNELLLVDFFVLGKIQVSSFNNGF